MGLFNKQRSDKEQEEYEQFMTGFRKGYPVEDEDPTAIPSDDNEQFQRGLQAGKEACERSRRK